MREGGRDREDCPKRTLSLVEGKSGKAWREEGAFQTETRWGGGWLKVKIRAELMQFCAAQGLGWCLLQRNSLSIKECSFVNL